MIVRTTTSQLALHGRSPCLSEQERESATFLVDAVALGPHVRLW
jgi:hypothetical protein